MQPVMNATSFINGQRELYLYYPGLFRIRLYHFLIQQLGIKRKDPLI